MFQNLGYSIPFVVVRHYPQAIQTAAERLEGPVFTRDAVGCRTTLVALMVGSKTGFPVDGGCRAARVPVCGRLRQSPHLRP